MSLLPDDDDEVSIVDLNTLVSSSGFPFVLNDLSGKTRKTAVTGHELPDLRLVNFFLDEPEVLKSTNLTITRNKRENQKKLENLEKKEKRENDEQLATNYLLLTT